MGLWLAGAQNMFPLTWSGNVSAARLIMMIGSYGLSGSKDPSSEAIVTLW